MLQTQWQNYETPKPILLMMNQRKTPNLYNQMHQLTAEAFTTKHNQFQQNCYSKKKVATMICADEASAKEIKKALQKSAATLRGKKCIFECFDD